jgi:chromate transport protein ChrA
MNTINNPIFEEPVFWLGLCFAGAIPGPYMSLPIFLGTYYGGTVTGIACGFAIYFPSVCHIWTLIPYSF